MAKLFSFLFIFVFLIINVSAINLSIYPSKLSFNSSIGEMQCQNIFLNSDSGNVLVGSDLWSYSKSNSLIDYNISSDEFEVEIFYPKNFSIENRTKIEVCIIGNKKGNFYGALLYKIDGKPLRAGTWIELNVEGNDLIKITGNAILNDSYGNYLITPIILVVILIGLLIWKKKRRASDI